MKFLTLTLNNFLVFEGQHFIDLSNINSCIVSGINGAGKSTLILDTILFAMYGQARQKGAGCITLGQEEGQVIFTFEHNNEHYTIEREVVNKKVSTKLKILKNTEDISGATTTETQRIIEEKVLGFSKELFLTLCCSLQGQIDNFAQQSPQEKQQIFSELLRYDVWVERKSVASKFLKELNEGISSLKGQVLLLADKKKRFDILTNEKNSAQKNLDKYLEIYPFLEKEQQEIFSLWEKSRYNISLLNQLTVSRKRDIEMFEHNAEELINIQKSKNKINKEKYEKYKETLTISKDELIQEENLLLKTKSMKDILENTFVFHKHYKKIQEETAYIHTVPCVNLDIHDYCPLLKLSIDKNKELQEYIKNNGIKNLENEINTIQQNLNILLSSIKKIEENIQSLQKRIQTTTQEMSEYVIHERYLLEILNKEKDLEQQNVILKQSIKEYTEKLEECGRIDDYEKEYKEKTSLLKNCKKQIDDNILIISNIDARQKELSEDINNLEKIEQKIIQFEQEEKEWKYLIQLYDKIPALLLEELIPIIEDEANNILQILNVQYQIKIEVFQETKTTHNQRKVLDIVYVTDNGTISFNSLSGSEKFKQALALRIALSKTLEYVFGIKIGVFIIDEGFGCLDSEGLQDVKKVLEPLASQFNFFCIITHIDELKDSFDTQIIVHQNTNIKIEVVNN